MSEQVVILPGLICDSRMFGAQIRAFDALVVDGFYDGADRIEGMAAYALARLPRRCALLGHSMGARVALEIWRQAPDRIGRLALADTGVHPTRPGEAEQRYALRDLGRSAGSEALADRWLPPMIGPAHRNDPGLYAVLRTMVIDGGTAAFERQIEALLNRPAVESLLPTISCPTFVIAGCEDEWSPVAQHESIAASIDGAQLRLVENAGHMAPAEEPERFNDVMREWLAWPSTQ